MTSKFIVYPFLIVSTLFATCRKKCDCATAPCLLPSLSNGLIAYYPFKGNANDESGYGNHVVFNNAILTTDRNNKPNSAYQFNGVSSYMRVANSSDINPQKISLCAIVKPMGFYTGKFHANVILYKGFQDQDIFNVYYMRFSEGPGSVNVDPNSTKVDTLHQVFLGSFAGNTPAPVGGPYIQTNKWYSIVYTFDGSIANLYVDGTLVSSINNNSAYQPSTTDLYFGKTINPNYPYWFNGVIDEIRIYNRALNLSEVKSFGSTCNLE